MKVYSPNNEELCELRDYEFTGNHMGETLINATKTSPNPIDFSVGSYVIYKGETFKIYYPKPAVDKTGRSNENIGDAFSYSLVFRSMQRKLQDIGFYDYVPGYDDTEIYYTGNPQVDFFGTAVELIGRISANLDRYYREQGESNPWNVSLDEGFANKVYNGEVVLEEKTISASNASCWDALLICNDQFSLEFQINGTNIKVGAEGEVLGFSLQYGKDKGLRTLGISYDDTEKLFTRLKVVGSSENLPEDYRKGDLGVATNLRLPESWGKDYVDIDWDYDPSKPETLIWRELKEQYGVIEASKEPYEDIRPSIEDSKSETGEYLDEIKVGTGDLTDDDSIFSVTVVYPGFDPLALAITGDQPRISIKSQRRDSNAARLGGYEFTITGTSVAGNRMNLICARNTQEVSPLPSTALSLDEGDKFVYLGVQMPEAYVDLAEDKLLDRAKYDVQNNNGAYVQHIMQPSAIYMAKNPEIAALLIPGNRIPMLDEDLGLEGQPIKIQSVTVRHDDAIPVYDLTLSNIKFKTLKDSIRITNQNVSNNNKLIQNIVNSTSNTTNIIGGQTPSWEIRD